MHENTKVYKRKVSCSEPGPMLDMRFAGNKTKATWEFTSVELLTIFYSVKPRHFFKVAIYYHSPPEYNLGIKESLLHQINLALCM